MPFQSEKISKAVNAEGLTMPTRIRKRSGSWEKFNPEKIYNAVQRCYDQTGKKPKVTAQELTERVVAGLASSKGTKNVEGIQDSIEFCLNTAGDFTHAREFILYREERTKSRSKTIPNAVIDAFAADKNFLPSPGQQFLFYDKYSKYNRDLDGGRRETWNETVDRVVDHLRWEVDQHVAAEAAKGNKVEGVSNEVFAEIYDGILKTDVMPSMRLLAMAGPAVRRNSLALYNCSYLPVRDTQAFVEALLISMNGCGVGFSVERENVERFPRIKRQKKNQEVETHYVEDTTEGWAEAVRIGLETWWDGYDIKFDTSFVRPAGSILFTKGGRSSGPEPLEKMLHHLREIVLSRQGSFLRTSDAHLMMCHVGDAAVQGGTRRTAMISLFSQDDHDMLTIKSGPNMDPVLWNANNSAVWAEEQDDLTIMKQMVAMIEGKSGEPGIFSRTNAQNTKPAGRKKAEFGTNPCGEIILRPYGLCNLSQAVSRFGDTEEDLARKIRLATIIGIIQSLSTRFPGMRDEWEKNTVEERLLGVDLTAQHTCEILRPGAEDGDKIRERMRNLTDEVAADYAAKLNINVPAATTTNKPAGNSSELLDVTSGIHAAHAPFYIRRYTVGTHSPLFKVLREAGAPMEPRFGSTPENATSWILSIPRKAAPGVATKKEMTALDQLGYWKLNKIHYTRHNPSVTISYYPDEILDIVSWVCKNKEIVGGLSFLPASDHVYAQAPYEEISEEKYNDLVAAFPDIKWEMIHVYEQEDMTTAAQELACFAGTCEV